MKWDDLKVFLAVARGESLLAAGKALALDPATLGRRIQALERSMGTRLFDRSQKGYQLTEIGVQLLPHAEAMETAAISALAEASTGAGTLKGTVRIGAPDGAANFLMPEIAQKLSERYPMVSVQIVALPRVFNLSKREADLAIAVSPPKQGGRLRVRAISDYHLHLYATRSYLKAHPVIKTRSDLKAHRMIGYIPDLIYDENLDYFREFLDDRLPDISSNSVLVQQRLVKNGAGLSILHDFAACDDPELVKVLEDEIHIARRFYLISHADDKAIKLYTETAEMIASLMRIKLQNT